ncbi:MAG TPA: trypsin-like peptidase domain-containing protein, partial [Nakamurella sp.]
GRRAGRRRVAVVSAAVAAAAVVALGSTLALGHGADVAGTAVAAAVQVSPAAGSTVKPTAPGYGGSGGLSPYGGSGGLSPYGGSGGGAASGNGLTGPGSQGLSTSTSASATTAQELGVVDIDTVLGYDGAQAAGTGLVLTSSGEILTNNHVVEGSTSITVTVVATGQSYQASVVGTDLTADVAVLQLGGASGLSTANLAGSAVTVGDAVTGVGNAGGVGGTPAASPGTVTATDQQITTQAEGSAAAETLTGLIETDADIQAGDSGGPLFNAADQVVGIDTAAEQGGYTTAGYAIPISTAVSIAGRIESGQGSTTITIGYPAFLGVQVSPTTTGGGYRSLQPTTTAGALISGVVTGGPAERAGLTAGDTITGIDGTAIGGTADLTSVLAGHTPGQTVTITWTDTTGSVHTAAVTLATGPAA